MAQAQRKSIRCDRANIVLSVTDREALRFAAAAPAPCWDVVELRVDLLREIREAGDLRCPLLLTARHPDEGGNPEISSDDERAGLLEPLLPVAAALDVEIARAEAMGPSIEAARAAGLLLVLSAHDFRETPLRAELGSTVRRGIDLGADIVKIACQARDAAEVDRLLGLLEDFPDTPLSVMAMGPLGRESRLRAARAGSVLNYACHERAAVEGQWNAEDFAARLAEEGIR